MKFVFFNLNLTYFIILKSFIENFEIEQNHPDIEYSKLIYADLNSLLRGS